MNATELQKTAGY